MFNLFDAICEQKVCFCTIVFKDFMYSEEINFASSIWIANVSRIHGCISKRCFFPSECSYGIYQQGLTGPSKHWPLKTFFCPFWSLTDCGYCLTLYLFFRILRIINFFFVPNNVYMPVYKLSFVLNLTHCIYHTTPLFYFPFFLFLFLFFPSVS